MKYDFLCWNKLVSTEEIIEINTVVQNNKDPNLIDGAAKDVTKTAKVDLLPWRYLRPNLERIYETWMMANCDSFGYNLYPMRNTDLWNCNTYDSINNAEYDYHTDRDSKKPSDIKLTGIVNISDEPYEGGEFIAFYDGGFKKVPEISQPGDVLLLRHDVVHKVNPVTKGIRKTLSFWFYGPAFI